MKKVSKTIKLRRINDFAMLKIRLNKNLIDNIKQNIFFVIFKIQLLNYINKFILGFNLKYFIN